MADKLGLGSEVRELKLGTTFTNPRSTAFHSIRYDFKPASVDLNKKSSVEIGNNNQVTVSVPHLDGAGPQTLFKGSQKPYQKECVLIIDRVTGEITLEKLSSNIQVKKTRAESYKPPAPSSHSNRPVTPIDNPTPITQRVSSKTKVTSGSKRKPIGLIPKHSPLHASPNHHASPSTRPIERHNHNNDTVPIVNNTSINNSHSMLASLPMIGLDDLDSHTSAHHPQQPISNPINNSHSRTPPSPILPQHHIEDEPNGIGTISDSSSSSSSDSGSSDSESDAEPPKPPPARNQPSVNNGISSRPTNGKAVGLSLPDHLLTEDLCLSESASDSD